MPGVAYRPTRCGCWTRRPMPTWCQRPRLPPNICPMSPSPTSTSSNRVFANANIRYLEDPRLVRGLDYYNRTVFEYVPQSYQAAQSAVGGGGRYDGLVELLGGTATPGVGLALGFDRILLALGARPAARALDVFLVIVDPSRRAEAQAFARRLRDSGVRCDLAAGERSVKAQFKAADRRDAAAAVVIGEEWDQGMVKVKDLSSGDELMLAAGDLASWAAASRAGAR